MTPIAIIMMIIAMVTVWGGLVASLIHLSRHPDEESGDITISTGPTT